MPCSGCGNGSRYKGMINDKDGNTDSDSIKNDVRSHINENERMFNELNNLSFDELEDIKRKSDDSFQEVFIKSFDHMSEPFKASQILNLVDIANGEKFSPQGHTAEYCIKLLNILLELESFSGVNKRFPKLREQVSTRFTELQKNRIVV